ncbi:MAG TPA: S8 family serine peptidase, partial [Verrucomicrobiae bacterium]|nr:S8 family serine peptidase [Verrucomicrobiae bacterium]
MPRIFGVILNVFLCLSLVDFANGMDQARVETRIDEAVATFGVTGRGVMVAILDRGVDWQNNDFHNADGSTRLAGILDLTDDSGSNAPANPYHLGTLCTRQQIEDAGRYGTNLVTRDALGHGTTTTGIACGNGHNVAKYRGAAPEATILVVKMVAENVPAHDNQPAETPFFDLNRLPIAIRYVRDQQRQLGMPCVMLFNVGSSGGPMDGTSALCQTINANVGPGIPGLVFVTGASDDGGIANHAAGRVAAGTNATVVVHKGNVGDLTFDLWYHDGDRFDVSIQSPSNSYGPFQAPNADSGFDTHNTSDFLYYQLGGSANFYGTSPTEREIWARLTGPAGDYRVT